MIRIKTIPKIQIQIFKLNRSYTIFRNIIRNFTYIYNTYIIPLDDDIYNFVFNDIGISNLCFYNFLNLFYKINDDFFGDSIPSDAD